MIEWMLNLLVMFGMGMAAWAVFLFVCWILSSVRDWIYFGLHSD